jgi:hypothetical protein
LAAPSTLSSFRTDDVIQNMCLNAPRITGELKYIVLRLFKKVRDHHQKRLFDGFYINPGTVLRCDGTTSRSLDDGHDLSATFICLPYLSLNFPAEYASKVSSEYPTRSILQVLYPYESTSIRETPPSFCKGASSSLDRIMYVPQLWTVIVGSSKLNLLNKHHYSS